MESSRDARATANAWLCPTCQREVSTAFCAHCGERRLVPRDLTLRGASERLLHALTSIDGRVLRTSWKLLRQPGSLSVAYLAGARKAYASPVSLFLIANVLFFAAQSLTGTNIFGASLDSHLHQQDWSSLAQTLLQRHLQGAHTTLEIYAPVFDRANVLHAKTLVILMVLPFALSLSLVFFRERLPTMCHVVFSLHFFAFLLLLFSASVLLVGANVALGGASLQAPAVDNVLSALNFAACVAYLYLATGPVYAPGLIARAIKAVLLTVVVAAIVLGYRFVLLPITLALT